MDSSNQEIKLIKEELLKIDEPKEVDKSCIFKYFCCYQNTI